MFTKTMPTRVHLSEPQKAPQKDQGQARRFLNPYALILIWKGCYYSLIAYPLLVDQSVWEGQMSAVSIGINKRSWDFVLFKTLSINLALEHILASLNWSLCLIYEKKWPPMRGIMVLYGFQEALIEPSKLQLLANHSGVGGNITCMEKSSILRWLFSTGQGPHGGCTVTGTR